MPKRLKRYYGRGELHFLTFSCYRRLPLLGTALARTRFVKELARVRVYSAKKQKEKLDYMHANPVHRSLVKHPKDWPWSSWSHYEKGEAGLIRVDPLGEEARTQPPKSPSKQRQKPHP